MCEQLDVKLFSKGCQIRRHHTAGGQVHLVTAGLHLLQEREPSQGLNVQCRKWNMAKLHNRKTSSSECVSGLDK